MDINEDKWIEIFRAGEYPGKATLTEEDVAAMAADYDPNHRVGTIHIGHPGWLDPEQPAHGMIAELRAAGRSLQAKFKNLSKELKQGIKEGKWLNWSVELIPPRWSETGNWYLTGLAFLGASQPAVPGMVNRFTFSLADDKFRSTSFEFADTEEMKPPTAKETAMGDTPSTADFEKLQNQVSELMGKVEKLSQRPDIPQEDFDKLKAKADQFDDADRERKEFKQQLDKAELDKGKAEVDKLFDAWTKDGKMLPAFKDCGIVEAMYELRAHNADDAFKFTSGTDSKSIFDAFKTFFEALPKFLTYDELTQEVNNDSPAQSESKRYKNPDEKSVNIDERARQLMSADENLSYRDAVAQAAKEGK